MAKLFIHFFLIFGMIVFQAAAQRPTLISTCNSSMGVGRCATSEKSCSQFGGIVVDELRFSTLIDLDVGCGKDEECCVLLDLPMKDSCLSCGATGIRDLATKDSDDGLSKRRMPIFDESREPLFPGRSDFHSLESKIARIAKPNKWCWQVAIVDENGTLIGSGVLIDGRHVLTAAHVVFGRDPEKVSLILGSSDFTSTVERKDEAVWSTHPKTVFIHHEFDEQTFANDLAILRIPFVPCNQRNICPVCLNNVPAEADFANEQKRDSCFLTAWGPISAAGFPASLREIPTQEVEATQCSKSLQNLGIRNFTSPDTLFCAKNKKEVEGNQIQICESDGGSPFVCQGGDDKWYLRGMVAFGVDACISESSHPFFLTDVGMFFTWIRIMTGLTEARLAAIPGFQGMGIIQQQGPDQSNKWDKNPFQFFPR